MLITSWWLIDLLLILVPSVFFLYKYLTRNFDHWEKRGVVFDKPLPIFGNAKDVFFFKKTLGEWLKELYDTATGDYRGIFISDQPSLLITSPHLVKRIMVQDSNIFIDRSIACPDHNKIISNLIFFQKGQEWKTMRAKLTPIFSSGKIKQMLPLVQRIGENLIHYLQQNHGELEAQEVFVKYTTDIICKCVFGIDAHCLEDENAIFRKLTKSMSDFSLRNGICQTFYWIKHSWVSTFKLNFFATWILEYFEKAFWDIMKTRKETKVRANDIIDLLGDLMEKQEIPDFVGSKVAAQATQFLAAGFDTMATTISHTLYELALNSDIQEKVRFEIENVMEEHGFTYEGLKELKYLNLCIQETLRKYPVLAFLDRLCLADYKVPGSDFIIEKGTIIFIPVFGLHLDENVFPDPQKYDPERFLENVNNDTNGMMYLPFGDGPRSCIGERFAQMILKTSLVQILSRFEVEKSVKTPMPIEFEPKSFLTQSKVGIPIIFKQLDRDLDVNTRPT